MNKYNLKSIALPGLVVAEFHDYYGRTGDLTPSKINYNQKLLDAVLEIEKLKINKEDIVKVKISVETDLRDRSLRTLHTLIVINTHDGEVEGHKIEALIDRLAIRESNKSNELRDQAVGSIFFGVVSVFTFYFRKIYPVYALATSLIAAVISIGFLYSVIQMVIKSKKNKNILLALTALEEGIKAAEKTQKDLTASQKTKQRKKI